jgi:cyclopropane fatty-acyl-phospholipid synthase-like methyltransferase
VTYTETDLMTAIDRLVPGGATADGATAEAWQHLDQYHVGGSQAVERLLVTLMLSPSDVVLDIGSGFGGPARQVATA